MKKLVLTYYCTDEYTYGYDVILPFEYKSKKDAENDLSKLVNSYVLQCKDNIYIRGDVKFAGMDLSLRDFIEFSGDKPVYSEPKMPMIYELEEWFEENKPKNKQ